MAHTYYPGSGIELTFYTHDKAGVLANADTIVVQHQDPSGAKTTLGSPTNTATGTYVVEYTFVEADANKTGINEFEIKTTGAVIAANKIALTCSKL
jgi:hypothetical protein